jgi:hypothetical protein
MISGKLDKVAVLKAICAGFEETTEPAICLSEGLHLPLFCVCGCVLPFKERTIAVHPFTLQKAKQVNWLHFSESLSFPRLMSFIRVPARIFYFPNIFCLQLLSKI